MQGAYDMAQAMQHADRINVQRVAPANRRTD
jgi:hypothetical protein